MVSQLILRNCRQMFVRAFVPSSPFKSVTVTKHSIIRGHYARRSPALPTPAGRAGREPPVSLHPGSSPSPSSPRLPHHLRRAWSTGDRRRGQRQRHPAGPPALLPARPGGRRARGRRGALLPPRAPIKAARPAGQGRARGSLAGRACAAQAARVAAPAPPASPPRPPPPPRAAGAPRRPALPCPARAAAEPRGPMEISLKYLPGGRAVASG